VAEGDDSWLGGAVPPIRDEGGGGRLRGGDGRPIGLEGRGEGRVSKNGGVKLPIEAAARGGRPAGIEAMPAVSRRTRRAWWSETVGM
jgi:hypothetical protein